jgi:hypothetical protein
MEEMLRNEGEGGIQAVRSAFGGTMRLDKVGNVERHLIHLGVAETRVSNRFHAWRVKLTH